MLSLLVCAFGWVSTLIFFQVEMSSRQLDMCLEFGRDWHGNRDFGLWYAVHPRNSAVKESACNAGDTRLIPGWGRAPGGGYDNPLQYSCLENPMDRGAWQATVHGVTQNRTGLKRLSTHTARCVVIKNLIEYPSTLYYKYPRFRVRFYWIHWFMICV